MPPYFPEPPKKVVPTMRMITLTTVFTSRNGKRVQPEIGKPFDYTDEEIAGLKGQTPPALRRVINETLPTVAEDPTQGL